MNYSLFLLVCCYKDITLKSVYNSFVSLSFCILCPLSLSSFFPFIWVISFFLTFILVYLNNFWFYRTLIFWLFIMNKYFWALFYCSGLSFCIKCYGARQVTFINVGGCCGIIWKSQTATSMKLIFFGTYLSSSNMTSALGQEGDWVWSIVRGFIPIIRMG